MRPPATTTASTAPPPNTTTTAASAAHTLLSHAHPASTAQALYRDRIRSKPLILRPTSPPRPKTTAITNPTPTTTAAASLGNPSHRTQRRIARQHGNGKEYQRQKSQRRRGGLGVLSAREKKVLGVHDLPVGKGGKKRKGKKNGWMGFGDGFGDGDGERGGHVHAHAHREEVVTYSVYRGLNRLWQGYVCEALGLRKATTTTITTTTTTSAAAATAATTTTSTTPRIGNEARKHTQVNKVADAADAAGVVVVSAQTHGAQLASLDYHGAELEVVRCRCVGRVGVSGVVIRDTKFTFVLVTRADVVMTIPKQDTIFRFEVAWPEEGGADGGGGESQAGDGGQEEEEEELGQVGEGQGETARMKSGKKPLVFELHGNQLLVRAADRANKKFKWKNMDYI